MLTRLTDELGEAYKRASEAEAEIAAVLENNRALLDHRHELMQENAKQGAEIAALKKRVQELEAQLKAKPRLEEESCDNCKYAGHGLSDYPCNICCGEKDDGWEPQQ